MWSLDFNLTIPGHMSLGKSLNFLVSVFSLDIKITIPYHRVVVRIRWDKTETVSPLVSQDVPRSALKRESLAKAKGVP